MHYKRILIVEDDVIIQMFVRRILTNMGLDVIGEVQSGPEVLNFLLTDQPDLILMDIGLKGPMDGIETAEEVNLIYRIPILFLTGNSDLATTERIRKTKPIGILSKPVGERELRAKLKSLSESKTD
ncbi:MAG: response regulator [Bacteroidetes bacterium]|nr:response regulator [Bacteroidota bacterium]